MAKIDKDLKLKKTYKYSLIIGGVILVLGLLFLNLYQNKNPWLDRLNPFVKMTTGYATLPTEVTYNGGKAYNQKEKDKGVPQYPDPYEDIYVVNTPFGEGTHLTFSGGKAPEGKNYAIVQHKGAYVKTISNNSRLLFLVQASFLKTPSPLFLHEWRGSFLFNVRKAGGRVLKKSNQ